MACNKCLKYIDILHIRYGNKIPCTWCLSSAYKMISDLNIILDLGKTPNATHNCFLNESSVYAYSAPICKSCVDRGLYALDNRFDAIRGYQEMKCTLCCAFGNVVNCICSSTRGCLACLTRVKNLKMINMPISNSQTKPSKVHIIDKK